MVIPLDDLKVVLPALIRVSIFARYGAIDFRPRWATHSSVSKEHPNRSNGKSDSEAAFCGYSDSDGGLQFGYCLLFAVDFKTELPLALLFAGGNAQDSPLTEPLLEQARTEHPLLAERGWLVVGDAGYDAVHIFEYILHRLRALLVITKNPRNTADPQADLATDTLCVLRRRSPWHKALFRSCRRSSAPTAASS